MIRRSSRPPPFLFSVKKQIISRLVQQYSPEDPFFHALDAHLPSNPVLPDTSDARAAFGLSLSLTSHYLRDYM